MANKLIPKQLHLSEVRILKGHIESPFNFKINKIKEFSSNFKFEMSFNKEEKIARSVFQVEVATVSNKKIKEEATGSFSLAFLFKVDNFEELVSYNDNETVDVDPGLGNAIAAITYSTTRGILITRFQGTVLQDFILPVISPNDLL